jgi:predicted RNA-binding Zn-ribbon protein involved in translation (DUF1610 family)
MTPLFGPSRRERDQLVHALRPMSKATLGQLGAALGWSPRKTSKVVRTLYAEEFPGFHYDPVRGLVELTPPPRAPVAAAAGAPRASAPPVNLAGDTGRPWGSTGQCPSCHVGMTSAGTGSTMYCPQCGRLSSARGHAAPSAAAPPSSPPVTAVSPHSGDRRTQELFAAWVTAQPIACPKCATNLQHRGVGQYTCPSCGHKVAFPVSSSVPAPLSTPGRSGAPPVALAASAAEPR